MYPVWVECSLEFPIAHVSTLSRAFLLSRMWCLPMNLNDIDEKTEQRLQDIVEDDEVAPNISGLVNFLRRIKKEENLSDEETRMLSYMVVNKLSFEFDVWFIYYEDDEGG